MSRKTSGRRSSMVTQGGESLLSEIRQAWQKEMSQRRVALTRLRDSALLLSRLLRMTSNPEYGPSRRFLQDKLMAAHHSLSLASDALSYVARWPAGIGTSKTKTERLRQRNLIKMILKASRT